MAKRFQFTIDHTIGRQSPNGCHLMQLTRVAPRPILCLRRHSPPNPMKFEIISIKHNGQPITLSDEEEEAPVGNRDWTCRRRSCRRIRIGS